MQLPAIHLLNGAWLFLVLVGVPAITSRHIGSIRLTSTPEAQMLTLWALGISAIANLVARQWLVKGKKAKTVCQNWAVLHAVILAFEYLHFKKLVHFEWLKNTLLWLKDRFNRI